MGRHPDDASGAKQNITIRLSPDRMRKLDRLRKERSRNAYIEHIIDRLSAAKNDVLPVEGSVFGRADDPITVDGIPEVPSDGYSRKEPCRHYRLRNGACLDCGAKKGQP